MLNNLTAARLNRYENNPGRKGESGYLYLSCLSVSRVSQHRSERAYEILKVIGERESRERERRPCENSANR